MRVPSSLALKHIAWQIYLDTAQYLRLIGCFHIWCNCLVKLTLMLPAPPVTFYTNMCYLFRFLIFFLFKLFEFNQVEVSWSFSNCMGALLHGCWRSSLSWVHIFPLDMDRLLCSSQPPSDIPGAPYIHVHVHNIHVNYIYMHICDMETSIP